MSVRGFAAALVMGLALVAPGVAGAAPNDPSGGRVWSSNIFRSPSGNIHCRYFPAISTGPIVACTTANTGLTVAVARYGSADHDYGNSIRSGGPVLPYGAHWTVGGFRCDSFSAGMQCRSSAGHGFYVNRTDYQTW